MTLFLPAAWGVFFFLQGITTPPDPLLERALRKIAVSEDYVGALADLEASLRGPNSNPQAHYQAGVCHTILRNYSKALDSFRKARELGVHGWELELGFGIAYIHLGRDAEARDHLERTLSLQPGDPNALFHLGRLDLKAGNAARATERFRQVLARQPDHQGALFSLGSALIRQGKEREGKQVLEHHRRIGHLQGRLKSLSLMADSPKASSEVFADLGDVYLELGRKEAALKAYQRAEQLTPGTALTGLGRGTLAYGKGDWTAARTHLLRYLEKVGGDCQGYLLLGLMEKQEKRYGLARQHLNRGLELCPGRLLILASLAELELQRGSVAGAEEFSEKIIRINSDFAAGPFFLAFCRIYQQRLEEAEELGLRTLELDDRNPNHHLLMKAVYQARGDAEKARHHEDRANQLRNGSGP